MFCHFAEFPHAEGHYAQCCILSIAMLKVDMLSVILLNVVMLSVVILSAIYAKFHKSDFYVEYHYA